MKLQVSKSQNSTMYYVAKSFRNEACKITSKIVERLGSVEEIQARAEGEEPLTWAKNYVKDKYENGTDCKRFILQTHCTTDGEVAQKRSLSRNLEMIEQEARFDGFYAVCTDLEDNALDIIKINSERWIIEQIRKIFLRNKNKRQKKDDIKLLHTATK